MGTAWSDIVSQIKKLQLLHQCPMAFIKRGAGGGGGGGYSKLTVS